MLNLIFKKLTETATIPSFTRENDACFDIVVDSIEMIGENKTIIHFGLACEIPKDYKLVLVPRSSFTHKSWIQANSPGQIDSEYRGEIQMRIEAIPTGINGMGIYPKLSYAPIPFKVGDRSIQAFLQKVEIYKITEENELSETTRGEGGFGSSGK